MFTIAEYLNMVLVCYPQPGMHIRALEIGEEHGQQFSANFLSYVCAIFTKVHKEEEQLAQSKQRLISTHFDADEYQKMVAYSKVNAMLHTLLGFPSIQYCTDYRYQSFQSMREVTGPQLKLTWAWRARPYDLITPYQETIVYPPAKFIDLARMLIYFSGRKNFIHLAWKHVGGTLITDESFLVFWNMQLMHTKLSQTIASLRANDRHWQRYLKDSSYKYVRKLALERERDEFEKQMCAVFSV